ncbi:MAG: arginine repressor [Clostridiales bacterium]|jgi:transcriptional regulator of arginine metabolism|nr:arginine repressor [Clostridiales bacterium]
MPKSKRQAKILELISNGAVETQDELTALLCTAGFDVTQATVSRDIKELGLVKTASDGGAYKYFQSIQTPKLSSRRIDLFKGAVVSVDSAENIIVIKTISGSASSAAALVDTLKEPAILGTVAGDDTIFVVVKDKSKVDHVIERFNSYIN